uniref:G-protein coupled receptors family 1 profile domain-containing protein n=1 Tax=Plectus sambesii TaxID=2011161 RepID=A0A914VSU4_9BILA
MEVCNITNETNPCVFADHVGDDPVANWLVGVISLFFSIACVAPYVIILKIIAADKELKDVPAYRIMFHLGISDVTQGVLLAIGGPFTMCQCTLHPIINKICGGILNSAFFAYIPLTVLLAFNRLVIFFSPSKTGVLLGKKFTTICIIACWLWGLLFFSFYLSPWVGLAYFPAEYTWGYDESVMSEAAETLELYATVSQLAACGVIYGLIAIKLILTRRAFGNQSSEMRHEFRFLLQAALTAGYCMFVQFAWHNYGLFFDDQKWTYFAVNMMWIFNVGVNPTVYLALNKTLRGRFVEMCGLKKQTSINPTTTF